MRQVAQEADGVGEHRPPPAGRAVSKGRARASGSSVWKSPAPTLAAAAAPCPSVSALKREDLPALL